MYLPPRTHLFRTVFSFYIFKIHYTSDEFNAWHIYRKPTFTCSESVSYSHAQSRQIKRHTNRKCGMWIFITLFMLTEDLPLSSVTLAIPTFTKIKSKSFHLTKQDHIQSPITPLLLPLTSFRPVLKQGHYSGRSFLISSFWSKPSLKYHQWHQWSFNQHPSKNVLKKDKL